jgi:hypothetical protein
VVEGPSTIVATEACSVVVWWSDVDDHDAALALFPRWRDGRSVPAIATLDRKLDPTSLALTALFLFFLEDFFDDPGIQHGGPPFGLM